MYKTKEVAYYGILICLALIFSYIERIIPFDIGIPGIKLGLANIVILLALYKFNNRAAFLLSILRVVISGMLFGTIASILYSLSGGILSLFAQIIAKKHGKLSIVGVSMLGGITHNIGQLSVAVIFVGSTKILYYLPVLLIAGLITGFLIGYVVKLFIERVK